METTTESTKSTKLVSGNRVYEIIKTSSRFGTNFYVYSCMKGRENSNLNSIVRGFKYFLNLNDMRNHYKSFTEAQWVQIMSL